MLAGAGIVTAGSFCRSLFQVQGPTAVVNVSSHGDRHG